MQINFLTLGVTIKMKCIGHQKVTVARQFLITFNYQLMKKKLFLQTFGTFQIVSLLVSFVE